jgi:hypothetical protein
MTSNMVAGIHLKEVIIMKFRAKKLLLSFKGLNLSIGENVLLCKLSTRRSHEGSHFLANGCPTLRESWEALLLSGYGMFPAPGPSDLTKLQRGFTTWAHRALSSFEVGEGLDYRK